MELKILAVDKKVEVFSQGEDGVLNYQGHLCVLNIDS